MPASTPPPSGSSKLALVTVLALVVIGVILLSQRSFFSNHLKGDTTTSGGYLAYCCKGMTGPNDCVAYMPASGITCLTTADTDPNIGCGNPRCTIAPKLTVTRTIVNNTGGPQPNSFFTLKLDGTISLTSGTQVTTTVGTHSIDVPSDSRYTFAWSGHCSGTNSSTTIILASGDVKACTITITYVPPVCNSPLQSVDGPTGDWPCTKLPSPATTVQINAYYTCLAPFKVQRTSSMTAAQTEAAAQALVQNSADQKCQQTSGGVMVPDCTAAPNQSPCHQTGMTYKFLGGSYVCKTTASAHGSCSTMVVGQWCVCNINGGHCKATATCSL